MEILSSIQKCLQKNPDLDTTDLDKRKSDGVENIYFDSDSAGAPGSQDRQQGPYGYVDSLDQVTVKNGDSYDTVSAKTFVSDDRFAGLGSPTDRLKILQKSSGYEVKRGDGSHCKALPVDPELQAEVDQLEVEKTEVREMQSLKSFVSQPAATDSIPMGQGLRSLWHYVAPSQAPVEVRRF